MKMDFFSEDFIFELFSAITLNEYAAYTGNIWQKEKFNHSLKKAQF
jgi:hypothetical protein